MRLKQSAICTIALFVLVFSSLFTSLAVASSTDLYYLVVDRSASIEKNGLINPITDFVKGLSAEVSEDSDIELVFFGDRAARPDKWGPMDESARKKFMRHFEKYFRPSGKTRLYDTVAEVIQRVVAVENSYRFVYIFVLSDGEDNVSQRYDWNSIQEMLPERWTNASKYDQRVRGLFFTFLYEPAPENRPPAGGFVEMVPVMSIEEIKVSMIPPPSANFRGHPRKVKVGEPVMFMLEYPHGVRTVTWSLGDGSSSDLLQFTHMYQKEGHYNVAVEVDGVLGAKDRHEENEYIQVVQDIPLSAAFSWIPELPRVGDTVVFRDESQGGALKWDWYFPGDQVVSDRNPTHQFSTPGDMSVSLLVTKDSETNMISHTITVLPAPPVATFSASSLSLEFGQKVTFSANETQDGWTHNWLIDEDISLEGDQVEWVADRSGRIEVVHSVSGEGGMVDDYVVIVVAGEPEPLTPAFTWSPQEVRIGDSVQLVDNSVGNPRFWTWNIAGLGKFVERNPVVTFQTEGLVTISLTIERDGRQASIEKSIQVQPELIPLQVAFSVDRKKGTMPLEVSFHDKSSGLISVWHWDFGDGQTSDIRNPVHTYEESGHYTPRLMVRDSLGNEAKDAGAITVTVQSPMPVWLKALFVLIGMIIAWILLFVPIVLNPIMKVKKGARLVSASKRYELFRFARSPVGPLWPKTTITIGASPKDSIRIPSSSSEKSTYVKIQRIPGSHSYIVTALKNGSLQEVTESVDMNGQKQKQLQVRKKLTLSGREVALKIADSEFKWEATVVKAKGK